MKLNDLCLTIEQAKELKALGLRYKDPSTLFVKCVSNWQGNEISEPSWKLTHTIKAVVQGFEKFEYFPTLTITEMLELLPDYIDGRMRVMLEINKCNGWNIKYSGIYETQNKSLRDALFGIIKYLKTNKLI